MTIELKRKDSPYIYRVNPHQTRNVDRRENRHGARWKHFSHHDSTFAAIEALVKIERDTKEPNR